jgi:hypothetical protein
MLAGAPAWPQFMNNRVQFITFNFDNVVEEAFCSLVPMAYPNASPEDVAAFISPRVLHIHGSLPPLPGPHRSGQYRGWLAEAVNRINVIHEPGSEHDRTAAREALRQAHVVCFLGFGYHQENLKKIGFEAGSKPAPGAEIFCCGYQVPPADRAEARGWIGTDRTMRNEDRHTVPSVRFGNHDHDALEFLRQHHILRSSL